MFYKKTFNRFGSKGFTLFELLIVILLVAVVGGISTVILVSSLRGSDRTNSINKVRTNGYYAITQMTKMIKYAKSFDGISNADWHSNPNAWVGNCDSTPDPKTYLKITSFDGGITFFTCVDANGLPDRGEISSNSASLIDPNSVKVESCSITCRRVSTNEPATITIDFALSNVSGSNLYEKQASIPFHTSVTMRNY